MEVKITYAYDGSKFYGMQRQKNKTTVQGEIENVLLKVFDEKVNMTNSGRTDRFVHALNQVSNFSIKKDIPLEIIKKQLNKYLFSKIKISDIESVDPSFNSRYDAKKRTYEYRFTHEKNISPFTANYISAVKDSTFLDVTNINNKLKLFIGTHNFMHYCKTDKASVNYERTIYFANCHMENDVFVVLISGNSFLKSMIRLIMASCIYEDEETIIERLNLKRLNTPKKILSPSGLYLKEVIY